MNSLDQMRFCPNCGSAFPEEKRFPLTCSNKDCSFVFYNNPQPVVAALVEVSGGVLLAHNKAWPAGMFAPITGFVEAGESPDQTVLREVEEELGLHPTLGSLVGVYGFPAMNQVIIAYHVIGEGSVSMNEELDDYRIIPVEKLKPWPFGTGLAVRDWIAMAARPTASFHHQAKLP